jgi:hypothetical protein
MNNNYKENKIKITPELFEEALKNGKRIKDLCITTGWSRDTLSRRAREWGFSFPEYDRTSKLTGKTFGKLYVIRQLRKDEHFKKGNQSVWLCRCECGKEKAIVGTNLTYMGTKCCGCNAWKGFKTLSGTYWRVMQYWAKKRNLEFNISKEYVWHIMEQQNFQCALSGIPIEFDRAWYKSQQTASVDRINSSLGYVENNIQILHKHINKMKMVDSNDHVIYWAYQAINGLNSRPWQLPNKDELKNIKIHHKYWKTVVKSSRKRSIELNITFDDIYNLLIKQGGLCALSGIPLIFHTNYNDHKTQTASLDRVDSTKIYEINNIQWIHRSLNKMKMNLPQDYFFYICKKIVEFDLEKKFDIIDETQTIN